MEQKVCIEEFYITTIIFLRESQEILDAGHLPLRIE